MIPTAAVNFGDLGMYSGGQFVPDGEYILNFNVAMYAGHNPKPGQKARLGILTDFYPKSDPNETARLQQFYSMGTKSDQFFMPNATGKGIAPVAGAAGGTLNDKTNWFLFLKSLMDSGLPPGIFTNDLTVIDGVHVRITNVDEPEERQSFQSNAATSEVTPQQGPRQKQKIAIVTEILEDGKPWEGTGGLPTEAAATTTKPVAKATPKAKATPAAAAPDDLEAVKEAALTGISTVLEKKPNGCPRMLLRTETFKVLKGLVGEDMASKVVTNFFENEGNLSQVLGEMNYGVVGAQIKYLG